MVADDIREPFEGHDWFAQPVCAASAYRNLEEQ